MQFLKSMTGSRLVLVCVAVAGLVQMAAPTTGHAKNCGDPPDMLVVLDHSGSMSSSSGSQSKWSHAKNAVNNLVSTFEGQIRFGLMLFPHHPKTTSCAGGTVNVAVAASTKNSTAAALTAAYPTGLTPIASSLQNALNYLKGIDPGKKKYVLLMTDGTETCSGQPINQVNALMGAGIKTYVVGFGSGVSQTELNNLAQAGGTAIPGPVMYYKADNLTQLNTALKAIGSLVSCCGNGILDAGEKCDKSIAAGKAGACPSAAACNDKNACTVDSVAGTACSVVCSHAAVTVKKGGDGCCPPGATSLTDSDCPKACGNGLLEAGEKCDPKIKSGKGTCSSLASCNDKNVCTRDTLSGSACAVVCKNTPAKPSLKAKDGCCPKGYDKLDDLDCLPKCDPDSTKNCIDLCRGVKCPDKHYCFNGKCKPWPKSAGSDAWLDPASDGGGPGHGQGWNMTESAGCACEAGGPTSGGAAVTCLVGLLLIGLRRRRRS